MKKQEYEAPVLEVKAYAQFENVFTWCTKGNEKQGCVDVTGSGNDADKPVDVDPSESAALDGGSAGSGL